MRLIRTLAYGLRIIGVGIIRRAFTAGGRCGLGPQSDEELLAWLRSLAPAARGGEITGHLLGTASEENGVLILTPGYYSRDGGKTWIESPTAEQIQAALDERRKAPPAPHIGQNLGQALAYVRQHYGAQGYEDVDSGPSLGRVPDGTAVPQRFNTPPRTGNRPNRSIPTDFEE